MDIVATNEKNDEINAPREVMEASEKVFAERGGRENAPSRSFRKLPKAKSMYH